MAKDIVSGRGVLECKTSQNRNVFESAEGTPPSCYSFSGRRWKRGLIVSGLGVLALAIGVILLAEIHLTPGLKSQLVLLGSALIVGGLACQISAIRDLFGTLVIDDEGVAIRPSSTGFKIEWDKLDRWEVREQESQHLESPCIRLWIQGSECPVFIPYGWLDPNDRHQIRRTLKQRVPHREVLAG